MHAAAGMGRGRGQIQTVYRRTGSAETRNGSKDQLLVERGGTAINRSANQARVAALQVKRSQDASVDDPGREVGSLLLDAILHAISEPLRLVGVPRPGEIATGIAPHPLRYMGVSPQGLCPARGTSR